MLIEQTIEFEWRGLGPLDRTCILQLVNFTSKKIFKVNLRVDYYLLLKYLQNLTPNAKS